MDNNSFEFEQYLNCIHEDKWEEASRIKNNAIPRTLYKFISLENPPVCSSCKNELYCFCEVCNQNNECKHISENSKKLNTLNKNQLWLSSFNSYNDPFEFKVLFPDKSKVNGHEDVCFSLLSSIKKQLRISCFVGVGPYKDMPFWAYYANNHQGFCVEYNVKNPDFIFPVHYETRRVAIGNIFGIIIDGIMKAEEEGLLELDELPEKYISYVLLSALIKSANWMHENEFRIIQYARNPEEVGEYVNIKKLGLEPKQIFVGTSCEEKNKGRLVEIAKSKSILINEMYLDEFTSEYELKARPLY